MGCHENHALTHSQNKFFLLKDKNVLHPWGPNEQIGTHEKLSLGGGTRCVTIDPWVTLLDKTWWVG